ncbi:MAG: hypothetical protein ACRDBG_12440 [Waterburya sp.]
MSTLFFDIPDLIDNDPNQFTKYNQKIDSHDKCTTAVIKGIASNVNDILSDGLYITNSNITTIPTGSLAWRIYDGTVYHALPKQWLVFLDLGIPDFYYYKNIAGIGYLLNASLSMNYQATGDTIGNYLNTTPITRKAFKLNGLTTGLNFVASIPSGSTILRVNSTFKNTSGVVSISDDEINTAPTTVANKAFVDLSTNSLMVEVNSTTNAIVIIEYI